MRFTLTALALSGALLAGCSPNEAASPTPSPDPPEAVAPAEPVAEAAPEPVPPPAAEPEDQTWYVVSVSHDDCLLAKLVFGLDTPHEVIRALNDRGGRYTYLRNDDWMVAIIEPMGSPLFFVRGQSACRMARATALASG